MFTGIIQDIGILESKTTRYWTFSASRKICQQLQNGTSIAINGTCLTIFKKKENEFTVEIMPETLKKTTFHHLPLSSFVNLELPMKPETFFSGHIVQGHIDTVGKIKEIIKKKNSWLLTIEISEKFALYCINKGSVAVNGVSLTIIDCEKNFFTVGILPYTFKHTTFNTCHIHDLVNIEVDIIGKYIKKFIENR